MRSLSLNSSHDRRRFDCGDESVNKFLREAALQDQSRDLSRTTVFVKEEHEQRIVAFHTLLISHVVQEEIPADKPRIKREIPVVLLGQLGVDLEFQGQGLGDLLLVDAQVRIAEIAELIGIRSLVLDARNERLAAWYEDRGFVRYPGSMRMFKSLAAIRRLVEGG
jgi:GNAT superfamily N-acetyltransferase